MTEETTTATTEAPPVTTTTAPAPAATTAYGCCSDGAAHVMPMASALPVASDCCSSSTECSQEGQPAVEEGPPVDDGALIDALREVIDPELMINIVDLGLVYSINHTDRKVNVEMTLTSPACPAGPQIIMQSKLALEKLNGIDVAEIKLTMSPPWTPARMTDEARDQLGIF
jgi:metal-sulfur cluster biosynthetic enzyme